MSIQQSINQGITAAAALYTQTPGYEQKKAERAESESVKKDLSALSKAQKALGDISKENVDIEEVQGINKQITEAAKQSFLRHPEQSQFKDIYRAGLERDRNYRNNLRLLKKMEEANKQTAAVENAKVTQKANLKKWRNKYGKPDIR